MPQSRQPEDLLAAAFADQRKMETHLIADMLRIESISSELKEFKQDTKASLKKLENWIIGIVVITGTSLIATLFTIVTKLMGL
jgi:histidyl-tRNA synthetase